MIERPEVPECLSLRLPDGGSPLPVMVSVPHLGFDAPPDVTERDYAEGWYTTFARGYADAYADQIYHELHRLGAVQLGARISRLFVDVNRARDDFDERDGAVHAKKGVIRTRMINDGEIFARPVSRERAETWLRAYYDPYYGVLRACLERLRARFSRVVLLDLHTASSRGLKEREAVVGTSHGRTCGPPLADSLMACIAGHGFDVHLNTPGYAGGNLVRTFGRPAETGVHAVQIEFNSQLLMTTSRREYLRQVSRAEQPATDRGNLVRIRRCVRDLIEIAAGFADGRSAPPG